MMTTKERYWKEPEKHRAEAQYYRACNKEKVKQIKRRHYEKNREKILSQQKEYYQKNKDVILERERRRKEKNKEHLKITRKHYYQTHKDEYLVRGAQYRQRLKVEVFSYYSNGTIECRCCGENKIEFLTINHIFGNGREHRRKLGRGGTTLYRWLRKNDFPNGFEVLCYNCNCALGHCGYCPHDKRRI